LFPDFWEPQEGENADSWIKNLRMRTLFEKENDKFLEEDAQQQP